ncbi:MAG: DUF5667 domain-containing protein [Anaerolineae bacterium]|nr:DUF5667 domain-containing protein [Anaerolineae bacterium]NUQ02452.1 hypothetical protein [Anaerolineae bacterium]
MSEQYSDPDLLAKRLDQVLPPDSIKTPPETPDALVNTAASLAKLPVSALSPQMIARIETRMFEAFDAQHLPHRRSRMVRVETWRWMQTGLAASAAALLFFIVAPSVSASLPGSPLYPIKRQVEQAHLTLTQWMGDDAARSALLLDLAGRRASESLTLVERGVFDASLIESAVASLESAESSTASSTVRLRIRHAETLLVLDEVIREASVEELAEPGVIAALAEALDNAAHPVTLSPPADSEADGDEATEQPPMTEDAAVSLPESPTPTETTTPMTLSGTLATTPSATSTPPSTAAALPSLTPTPRITNTRRPTNTPRSNPTARPTNTHRPPGDSAATSVPPGQSGDNPGQSGDNPGNGNGGGKP